MDRAHGPATPLAAMGDRMLRRFRSLLALATLVLASIALGEGTAHAGKFTSYYNFPGLDWYVIQTEHFNVYYPVSKRTREQGNVHYVNGEWSARKAALVAEEMYPKICGQFNFYLKETVNIVMLEYLDELEGYTIPNFDWIVISTHHSDMLWRWRGHHDWLRVVLYHEYAHVVSLKADGVYAEEGFGWYLANSWYDPGSNTGVNAQLFVSSGPPWFWVEGGAEYYTDTAGINNWSSNRDMFMRMDILQGTLLELDEMGDYYGSNGGFDGERHYNEGYNFALYLEEKFGQGVYQSFALNRAKKGWEPDWTNVIEDTLHVSMEELYEGWKKWATEKYRKVEAEVMKAPAIGGPLSMDTAVWESDDPQARARFESLRWIDRKKKQEATGRHNFFQKYSPDGRFYSQYDIGSAYLFVETPEDSWPVFSGRHGNPEDKDNVADRSDQKPDSKALQSYTDGQYDWLPDGSGIVYACNEVLLPEAAIKTNLWANTRGGFNLQQLCKGRIGHEMKKGKPHLDLQHPVPIPNTLRAQDPAVSPDGKRVAFSRFEDSTQNIVIVDLGTHETQQITHWRDGNRIEMLDWSPDGTQLVTGLFRQNQADIYVLNTDGTGLKPITFDKYEDRDPHWGTDGMIYFTSDRVGGIYNVFRYNPKYDPGNRDSDADTVKDRDDRCVGQKETVNGWRDEDGCPDEPPVRVTAEAIELVAPVEFGADGVPTAGSRDVLAYAARVLGEHPEITRVEVSGFTAVPPPPKRVRGRVPPPDVSAGQKRAEAVVAALTGSGVDATRLAALGLAANVGDAAPERIELRILTRDPSLAVAPAPSAPAAPAKASPADARLVQITNVVGGAFTPSLTPKGNLLYAAYTAFGWKSYGLPKSEFLERPVDDAPLDFPTTVVKLDVQEEVPSYQAQTRKVTDGGPRVPFVIPLVLVQNVSRSHTGVHAGVVLGTDDYLDHTNAFLQAIFGEITDIAAGVTFKHLWPNVTLFGRYGMYKYDYGFFFDTDQNTQTTDDQFTGDIKGAQNVIVGALDVDVPLNPLWRLNFTHLSYGFGFRGPSEGQAWEPYAYGARNTVSTVLAGFDESAFIYSPKFRINPRGVRAASFSYSANYSKMLYEATNGLEVDDYEYLSDYWFNEFEFAYSEFVAVDVKTATKTLDHTLQIDLDLGFIDRNVGYRDEFRAGGGGQGNVRNPWQSGTSFAGYPAYSLAGETKIVLNAAYRFPIKKDIDTKVGILYIESLYGQLFGTAGNLWSYRLKDGSQTEQVFSDVVATDPDDVEREVPFKDRASQNGNWMLFDAGLELRLTANLFNRSSWDSYVRLAYGFNSIGGLGDVDGDDIYTNTTDVNIATNSSERKPAGLRFYVGIGTGW